MMIHRLQSGPFAERARRSVREIVLAVALTCAALVFGVTALYRSAPETAAIPAPASQDGMPLGAQPVDGQATAPAAPTTKDL